jgi:hypothetical protein
MFEDTMEGPRREVCSWFVVEFPPFRFLSFGLDTVDSETAVRMLDIFLTVVLARQLLLMPH